MSKGFEKSIKEYELDQDGFVVGIKGSCKAKDLQKERIQEYFDDDFCVELGFRRLNF